MLDRQCIWVRRCHPCHERLGEGENFVRVRSDSDRHENMQAAASRGFREGHQLQGVQSGFDVQCRMSGVCEKPRLGINVDANPIRLPRRNRAARHDVHGDTAQVYQGELRRQGAGDHVLGELAGAVDVLKALALGARSVLVGRPVLWGLAVDGAAGAQRVLETLVSEFDRALALAGVRRADALDLSLITPSRW